MTITEIKRWAKEKGYKIIKADDPDNEGCSLYYWLKIDDENVCGIEKSVSKVARAIFNHMTDNKWVEYQQNYKPLEST